MPLDFTQYLSARLGLNSSAVNELLGIWLRTYEPDAVRREREQRDDDAPGRAADSGVAGSPEPPSLARTA